MTHAHHDPIEAQSAEINKAAKTATSLLAIYVHQLACDDARNPRPAGPGGQFGGLFRGLIRRAVAGDFDLYRAAPTMRRRRMS
jgi:hypothetical protein